LSYEKALYVIERKDPKYPALLEKRLGNDAPVCLWAIGNYELLKLPKTALFCSSRCPGDAILAAMDKARQWRDEGRCIISGFHSAVEKECLKILLRGNHPIIICPARSLANMRIPRDWRKDIEAGRILILSPFDPSQRRLTSALAEVRNRFAAALANDVYFTYIAPEGKTAQLTKQVAEWVIQ
jgi:predicted Rossmann fold nucleotide-binding protein DprA/Smf involved in DNA uptake